MSEVEAIHQQPPSNHHSVSEYPIDLQTTLLGQEIHTGTHGTAQGNINGFQSGGHQSIPNLPQNIFAGQQHQQQANNVNVPPAQQQISQQHHHPIHQNAAAPAYELQNTEGGASNVMLDTTNQMKHDNHIPQIINYNQQIPAAHPATHPTTQYQVSAANQNQYTMSQGNASQSAPGIVYALTQNGNQVVVDPNNMTVQPVAMQQTPNQANTHPTYVNAKQYHRIIKRREARRNLDEFYVKKRKQCREERAKAGMKRDRTDGEDSPGSDSNEGTRRQYIHESRHKHAMKRPRGPGGRFLTKDELVDHYKVHPDDDPKNYNDSS
eukprot:scaffold1521_cov271-Chaetoceros_neogracile.AAC.85